MKRREFLKASAIAAAAATIPGIKLAKAQEDQTYYMVTFVSGIDYWKDCFRGMQDAAEFLGVNVEYTGTPENDITAEVRVFEEVTGQNPAGILATIINPDAFVEPINNAIEAGLPVVCFDADSPLSNRYSFVGTGNYYAGVVAARYLGPIIGSGKVAISSVTAQLNHVQRRQGFIDTLAAEFPDVTTSDDLIVDDQNNSTTAAEKMSALLIAEPDIKGIFATDAAGAVGVGQAVREAGMSGDVSIVGFDYDEGTLDLIDSGELTATLAQGTWQMGFWGMMFLYAVANGLISSVSDWQAAGISPLPPNVDTGVVVITADNSQYWRAS
ncbi:substrate-binding domain-containing protein [Aggregatilinea lenta]|uniref:substrate-binding domain-containing protein n=1 Tax=Aggregatilinea lenta TaxID=913108 RepID=UPI000E5B8D50|nr:substrate-binding domain-containing protein [Aggregatilinea lenta]